MKKIVYTLSLLGLSLSLSGQKAEGFVQPNENLKAENIPSISKELAQKVKKYADTRAASFVALHPLKNEILISTRFGSVNQLHQVVTPLGSRKQITFFEEPLSDASYEPTQGKYFIYSKDTGGNEFGQLYKMDVKTFESTLLTDGGRSQNGNIIWKKDGSGFYFTSTKRNGGDRDIYFMNPSDPQSTQLILQNKGGGWSISDISKDGKKLLVQEYVSANESHLYLLDTSTRKLTNITNRQEKSIVQSNAQFARNSNEIWFETDRNNEFIRLATFNLQTQKITYHTSSIAWDVEGYELSKDKTKLAFVTNEAGVNKLYLMDALTKKYTLVKSIPMGLLSVGEFSKDGKSLFISLSTAQAPTDVYKVNVLNQSLERWTESEQGQMQPAIMSVPKLIEWKSFDGLKISGFYYPASSKFTGKRPVIINIHGGPEGQSLASSLGASNYYTQEMGIAMIYPNVRGSSGFGKTYLAMDNWYNRENSVKDIGALLDWVAQQPELDKDRIMIMGGSYGGYMTLATAFHYADKIRCSVDVVGISNFNTFLKNTEEYRRDLRRVEYGDERIPEMNQFLEKISPLNNTDKIKKPMFIIQGFNDPRVPVTEAMQMRDKLKAQGNTVWYLEAKNEGHGFRKKENVDFQRLAVIRFMEEYLLK